MKNCIYIVLLMLLASCGDEKRIAAGDEVHLFFTLKNSRGMRMDGSFQPSGKLPLRIIAGKHFLIEGFDEAIIGMREKEKKICRIAPDKAYGNNGVFFLDSAASKEYVILPNDSLELEVEIIKIGHADHD